MMILHCLSAGNLGRPLPTSMALHSVSSAPSMEEEEEDGMEIKTEEGLALHSVSSAPSMKEAEVKQISIRF